MSKIKWNTTASDQAVIDRIVKRAHAMQRRCGQDEDGQLVMDITACHLNGCRLDLEALLNADDLNFAHDVFGIRRHIDRSTAALCDHFVPRFKRR